MGTVPHEFTAPFTPAPGAVWCDDVGVVTGALELRTVRADDGATTVAVRYEGAEEWYPLRGATCRMADPADAEALHAVLVAVLDRPDGG